MLPDPRIPNPTSSPVIASSSGDIRLTWEAFSAGDRDTSQPPKLGVSSRVVIAQRLVVEEEIEFLDRARQVEGRAARPWLSHLHRVAVDRQLDSLPEGRAQPRELGSFVLYSVTRRAGMPRAIRRRDVPGPQPSRPIGETGTELESSKAQADVELRLLHGFFDWPGSGTTRRVQGEPGVGRSAQQRMDRFTGRLAGEVPERQLDSRQHRDRQPDAAPP